MINIAIIDDDITFCDDFEEQIKKIDNSYNTDCYYDINTFLESVSSYNIAIIDIMLGKDNGIDIASAITEKQMRIIRMKLAGFRMHDIARTEKMTFRDINRALNDTYVIIETLL